MIGRIIHPDTFFLLATWMAAAATALGGERPNVIFVLADDLGYGDVGCYGQVKVPTPNTDRLAAGGMRFTDFYAGSTVCAPSRCTLMTGLHTGHAWVRGNARVPLRPQDTTVAELLKREGYTTALIGKWGLGEPKSTGVPNRKGFDYFFGYLNQGHAHNYYPEYLWRNQEQVELLGNQGGKKTQYSHDLFTQEALSFIESNRSKPFFLYLAYTIPHSNNELQRATGNGMEVPDLGSYADRPWTPQQKGHAAMVERMDRDIGRIMARLAELKLDDHTIVFFTSDNGPHHEGGYDPAFFDCGGPLRGIKRDLYEGGIRVPMIVRWPGHVEAGAVSHHAGAFWDILPTLAEITGTEPPAGIDGISILPALLGRPQREHEYLYWEFHEGGFKQAVRLGDYKAVRKKPGGPVELYDLKSDIGERKDIAGQHADIVARIEAIFDSARTDNPNWPVGTTSKPAAKKARPRRSTQHAAG